MRKIVISSNARPINCIPTGRPSRVKPQGTEMAGSPVKFAGRLCPTIAGRMPICSPSISTDSAPMGGAGTGSCRSHDGVDVLERFVKFGEQSFAHIKPSEIRWAGTFPPASIRCRTSSPYSAARDGKYPAASWTCSASASEISVAASSDSFKMWKRDFAHHRAVLFHVTQGGFGDAAHFGIKLLPIKLARAAQAKFAQRFLQRRRESLLPASTTMLDQGDRALPSGRAEWPRPQRCAPRADMVERRRQRHRSENADAPKGWL